MIGKTHQNPHAENDRLRAENEEIRLRLEEAQEALEAIRMGQVESLVVEGPDGPRIFTLETADHAYRALVEAMNEGAATVGEDGTILYCNARFAEMLATPLERVMGSPIQNFLPNRSQSAFAALAREADGRDSRGELELRSQTGELVPTYLSISVIRDGGRRRLCVVAADLRAQKRNEAILAAERLASSVLEQAADVIVVCDERGRIIRASASAAGICASDPLLAPFDRAFPLVAAVPNAPGGGDLLSGALCGEVLRAVPMSLTRPDGSKVDVLVSAGPLNGSDDRILGCVMTMVDVTEQRRGEEERRQAQKWLAADLEAMTRLQKLGSLFVREGSLQPVLGEIVDAAIAISGADFGNIQILDPMTSDLHIVAHRGFPQWWLDFWARVHHGKGACGQALAVRERVIVEDVERSPIFVGTPALDIQLRAGVHAVQSTPLSSRSGELLGMFSTHYRKPSRPDDRALRLLDLLARQAADILERAQIEGTLRQSEQRLQMAKRAAGLGIHDYDVVSGRIQWDERVRELWGVGSDELITYETFMAGLHPDDRAPAQAAVDRALDPESGGDYEAEYRVISRSDGRQRWVAATGEVTFVQGRPVRLVGTVQDVTRQKDLELALREADRRKNQFLAVLSHELRNPLAPIKNSLAILDRAPPGSDQARRAISVIDRQASQLARLVDDLLDVTRITRGKIQLQRQRLELNDLVQRTIDDHRSLFETKGVSMELVAASAPVHVNADGSRLGQVVGNLLQNAGKFTSRNGRIRVVVTSDPVRGCGVIRVIDDGVGMTPQMLSRLFEPFSQADETLDRSAGGLGLGLAIVKGLVELHGGEISARSEGLGKGAEFVVQLPLDQPEVSKPESLPTGAPHPRKRILIIEDNVDAADTLCEVLMFDEHQVEVAYSGPEALAKARTFLPEVVLCDIGLPGMDGYEVARAFRADDMFAGVFLIALSGYALPEDIKRGLDAGFDWHLAKPLSFQKLAEVLASLPSGSDRPRSSPLRAEH